MLQICSRSSCLSCKKAHFHDVTQAIRNAVRSAALNARRLHHEAYACALRVVLDCNTNLISVVASPASQISALIWGGGMFHFGRFSIICIAKMSGSRRLELVMVSLEPKKICIA